MISRNARPGTPLMSLNDSEMLHCLYEDILKQVAGVCHSRYSLSHMPAYTADPILKDTSATLGYTTWCDALANDCYKEAWIFIDAFGRFSSCQRGLKLVLELVRNPLRGRTPHGRERGHLRQPSLSHIFNLEWCTLRVLSVQYARHGDGRGASVWLLHGLILCW